MSQKGLPITTHLMCTLLRCLQRMRTQQSSDCVGRSKLCPKTCISNGFVLTNENSLLDTMSAKNRIALLNTWKPTHWIWCIATTPVSVSLCTPHQTRTVDGPGARFERRCRDFGCRVLSFFLNRFLELALKLAPGNGWGVQEFSFLQFWRPVEPYLWPVRIIGRICLRGHLSVDRLASESSPEMECHSGFAA